MKIENIEQSFELMQRENGIIGWYAHELSNFLGYVDFNTFKQVVRRARASADQTGFDSDKDFISIKINDLETYKLTRFGVLLCVMFADDKKPKVAQLKVLLSKFQDEVLTNYEIERVQERQKLSHADKYMTSTAYENGLPQDKISWFKDAGYRGMYNMGQKQLKEYKGVKSAKPIYDFMGLVETSANTFRATMTAEHIKNNKLQTSNEIINAAKEVGKDVRDMVIKKAGIKPENIQIENNIED